MPNVSDDQSSAQTNKELVDTVQTECRSSLGIRRWWRQYAPANGGHYGY